MDKEDLKKRVIEKAYIMFAKRGVKGVTMDNISSELSISKRTLYEMFSSKSKLLISILESNRQKQIAYDEKVMKEDIGSLEKMFHIAFIHKDRDMYAESLFIDLFENEPALLASAMDTNVERDVKRVFTCLELAVDEGFVDGNINLEIPVSISQANGAAIHSHGISPEFKLTLFEVHTYGVIFFLRSIATAKGIVEIDRLCKENSINIYKK